MDNFSNAAQRCQVFPDNWLLVMIQEYLWMEWDWHPCAQVKFSEYLLFIFAMGLGLIWFFNFERWCRKFANGLATLVMLVITQLPIARNKVIKAITHFPNMAIEQFHLRWTQLVARYHSYSPPSPVKSSTVPGAFPVDEAAHHPTTPPRQNSPGKYQKPAVIDGDMASPVAEEPTTLPSPIPPVDPSTATPTQRETVCPVPPADLTIKVQTDDGFLPVVPGFPVKKRSTKLHIPDFASMPRPAKKNPPVHEDSTGIGASAISRRRLVERRNQELEKELRDLKAKLASERETAGPSKSPEPESSGPVDGFVEEVEGLKDEIAVERQAKLEAVERAAALEKERDAAVVAAAEHLRQKVLEQEELLTNKVADLEKIIGQKHALLIESNQRVESLAASQKSACASEQQSKADNEGLKRTITGLEARVASDAALLVAAKEETAARDNEVEQSAQSKESIKKELRQSEGDRLKLQFNNDELRKTTESQEKELAESRTAVKDLSETLTRERQHNAAQMTQLEAQLEASRTSAGPGETPSGQALDNMIAEMNQLRGLYDASQRQLAVVTEERNRFQANGQMLESKYMAQSTKVSQLQHIHAEIGAQQAQPAPSTPSKDREIRRLQQEVEWLTSEPQRLKGLLSQAQGERDHFRREHEQLKSRFDEGQVAELTKQRDLMQEKFGDAVRKIQGLERAHGEFREIGQRAVREAVAEAVADKNKQIAKLRAQLQGDETPPSTPMNPTVNRSSPSSVKSSDSSLFSPGPRSKARLSSAAATNAQGLIDKQRIDALSKQLLDSASSIQRLEKELYEEQTRKDEQEQDFQREIAALTKENKLVTEEKDDALDKVADLELELDFYKASNELDDEMQVELEQANRKIDTQQLMLEAHASVRAAATGAGASSSTAKRVAAEELSRDGETEVSKRSLSHEQNALNRDFPYGYTHIDTIGEGMMCGFHALVHSLEAQYPDLPQVTVDDLRDLMRSPEYIEFSKPFGTTNSSNFSVDQLGGLLHMWYARHHNLNMHLGVLPTGIAPMILAGPDIDREDSRIVWISNDRHREIAEEQGLLPELRGVELLNHYEGLAPRPEHFSVKAARAADPCKRIGIVKPAKKSRAIDEMAEEMENLEIAREGPSERRILPLRSSRRVKFADPLVIEEKTSLFVSSDESEVSEEE